MVAVYMVDEYDGILYNWKAVRKEEVKTVFYKTYEDEITDIMIIIPNA